MKPSTAESVNPPIPGPRPIPLLITCVLIMASVGSPAHAQPGGQVINLTVERMIELGLRDSYQVQRLVLEVERTRSNLRAEQAGLKSRVELEVLAPEFEAITDYKWNSILQRNELVHENTRRAQAILSVRQPVILFGYPTDGYLSLNTRIYRYSQLAEERDVRYYNRYFVAYEQPLFQPNEMRHDLEEAELDLEEAEIDYQNEVIEMLDDLSDEYFELLEAAYERVIAESRVATLETATAAARSLAGADPARAIELDQLQVELANAQEQVQQASSSYRLQAENIKQSLRLPQDVSIEVDPDLVVRPVGVDPERALEYARTLAPRLRNLAIQLRGSEINLAQTKGRDSFRVDVELTYGRETQNESLNNLWAEPRNSYTVNVEATVPIWDWGERRHRITASEYSLQRTHLQIEETETEIVTNVRNVILNLEEYEQRALNMQENLGLAGRVTQSSLDRYEAGEIALVNLLQTISRESDTAANFMDAYMGFHQQLLRLRQLTHYDFEFDMPVAERFPVTPGATQR
ncbi:TolC family protein [Gemmatimonadota bacterium]